MTTPMVFKPTKRLWWGGYSAAALVLKLVFDMQKNIFAHRKKYSIFW